MWKTVAAINLSSGAGVYHAFVVIWVLFLSVQSSEIPPSLLGYPILSIWGSYIYYLVAHRTNRKWLV